MIISNEMKGYLFQRFIRNNHNKYTHYYQEWIDNITEDQYNYFILEKQRLNR